VEIKMSTPSTNESWIIDAGDVVIKKMTNHGDSCLSPFERLIYCVWVADYSMRNAGDLDAAHDIYSDFQIEAARLVRELELKRTHAAFALPTADLQHQYFDRFEEVCDEIRRCACGQVR